jgi:hypothetical protein
MLFVNELNYLLNLMKRIEACLFGAYPILPNRLVYPEIYPKECLFSTEAQLVKKLKQICMRPRFFRETRLKNAQKNSQNLKDDSSKSTSEADYLSRRIEDTRFYDKYKWKHLKPGYLSIFLES